MVPPVSDRISLVPPYSGFGYAATRFRIRGFHALRPTFPDCSSNKLRSMSPSYNPARAETPTVWAPPLSLTTTRGITVVIFSCRYLDVSVPCVRSIYHGNTSSRYWVPPFGNHGITGYLRLPRAYRSLSRPSSPLRA